MQTGGVIKEKALPLYEFFREAKRGLRFTFSFFCLTAVAPVAAETVIYPTDTITDPFTLNPVAVGPSAASPNNNTVTVTLSGGDSTVNESVYGGYSTTGGDVEANTVTVINGGGGGTIGGTVYGGRSDTGSLVGSNTVTVGDVAILGYVFGGSSDNATVTGNSVVINGATVGIDVVGGNSNLSTSSNNTAEITSGDVISGIVGGIGNDLALNNSVTVTGGTMVRAIGGISHIGDAIGNSVTFSSGLALDDIYGGQAQLTAAENTVTINSGIVGIFVYGGYSNSGESKDNTVTLNGGIVEERVYGGFAPVAVTGNTVNLIDGTINNGIIGGMSFLGAISDNTVTITGGTLARDVFGGFTFLGAVTDNTVSMSGGSVGGYLYGGFSGDEGNVTGNSVTFSGGTVGANVIGGYSYSGLVADNSVTVTNGVLNFEVYGGWGDLGAVTNNEVTLSGGQVNNHIYGGYATDGVATDNTVTISGGTATMDVYGGYSSTSSVTGNTVVMSGGTVSGDLYGGFSDSGSATGNSVAYSSGTLGGNIIGGRSNSGVANGNAVTISGGTVTNDVYGGFSNSGGTADTLNNTVTISGAPTLSSSNIYGGNQSLALGNILNWQTTTLMTVAGIFNFETYNFFLPNILANGQTLISILGGTPTNLSGTTVTITGIQGGGVSLQGGDVLTLINNTTNTPTTFNGTNVPKGIAEVYNFELVTNPTELQIRVIGGASPNPQTKALSEGWIAGLALGNQGADLVENQGVDNALQAAEGVTGPFAFGAVGGSSSRYKTGSHVDVKSFSMLTGIGVRGEFSCDSSFLLGGFFETGTGNYNSFNSFNISAAIAGDGDTSYVGGGFLAYYNPFECLYLEIAGRAGQTKTSFSSSDFTGFEGFNISYKDRATYYGIHAGLGTFFYCANAISLDLSSKFLWTRQEGSSFAVVGDPVVFKNSDSLRWRNRGRLFYDMYAYCTPFVGAAFEYEFDGKVKATVNNLVVTPPSLRGGTGVGEIGLVCEPFGDYSLFVEIGLQGYVGRRQGVSGNLQIKYFF